jgi:hypothetical protein
VQEKARNTPGGVKLRDGAGHELAACKRQQALERLFEPRGMAREEASLHVRRHDGCTCHQSQAGLVGPGLLTTRRTDL